MCSLFVPNLTMDVLFMVQAEPLSFESWIQFIIRHLSTICMSRLMKHHCVFIISSWVFSILWGSIPFLAIHWLPLWPMLQKLIYLLPLPRLLATLHGSLLLIFQYVPSSRLLHQTLCIGTILVKIIRIFQLYFTVCRWFQVRWWCGINLCWYRRGAC